MNINEGRERENDVFFFSYSYSRGIELGIGDCFFTTYSGGFRDLSPQADS